jgi:hypothetical protein
MWRLVAHNLYTDVLSCVGEWVSVPNVILWVRSLTDKTLKSVAGGGHSTAGDTSVTHFRSFRTAYRAAASPPSGTPVTTNVTLIIGQENVRMCYLSGGHGCHVASLAALARNSGVVCVCQYVCESSRPSFEGTLKR